MCSASITCRERATVISGTRQVLVTDLGDWAAVRLLMTLFVVSDTELVSPSNSYGRLAAKPKILVCLFVPLRVRGSQKVNELFIPSSLSHSLSLSLTPSLSLSLSLPPLSLALARARTYGLIFTAEKERQEKQRKGVGHEHGTSGKISKEKKKLSN